MKRKVLCVLFLGLCRVSPAPAADPATETKIFLDSVESSSDTKRITVREWFVTPEELDQLPVSNPLTDDAPLSLKQAIAIARGDLQKNLRASETWSLTSVALDQIDRGNSGVTAPGAWVDRKTGKWYYKVVFSVQRTDPVTKLLTYPFPVYVLMDGTIARDRVRPQTQEEATEEKQELDENRKTVIDADKRNGHRD